ncbi:MAG: hypothetical protein JWN34_1690 [Bryobacterales bacterium]|nr:hypothetical protein [Bryobacterales bacterium]
MTATAPASLQTGQRSQGKQTQRSTLAKGLGWFSIGLGVAEVITPGVVSKLIGVKNDAKTRKVLRGYGMRELAAGFGILTHSRPSGWVWSRVAGDVVDLASLATAMRTPANDKSRLAAATVAVAGITALDVVCGQRLSSQTPTESGTSSTQDNNTKVIRSIIVNSSPEAAYSFWHNFENLPQFMTYLESVKSTDTIRSHWVAKGPLGITTEWDAEVVRDEPNRLIAWKSLEGAPLDLAGSVQFEPSPGGRGTVIRVHMDFAAEGGALKSMAGKILGTDLGMRIQHDLRNFKQILELGEVTQSDASIHSGMHPAQPAA